MVRKIRFAFLFTIAIVLTGATTVRAQTLRVMTFNIAHGDHGGISAHVDFIIARDPDVVVLQEVSPGQENMYESLLEQRTNRPWDMKYQPNCELNKANPHPDAPNPTCDQDDGDGVAILSRLPFEGPADETLLWGRDPWTDARSALRVKVRVGDHFVQVFGTHLAAGGAAFEEVRTRQVNALKTWMAGFTGPRILGGDLNGVPGSGSMTTLSNGYVDAWAAVHPTENGPSSFTHSVESPSRRIDYWFSETGSAAQPISVERPPYPSGPLSDHFTVVAVYSFGSTPGNTPYGGTPAAVPGRFEAEKFDEGGEGIAYHDTTAGNSGGQFRVTDVDIEGTSDTGGGFNVGWFTASEWLEFTVNVASTSNYTLNARVASTGDGGRFHVEVDNTNVTGSLDVPNTGGWQNWSTVSKSGIHLTAGQHVIKFVGDADGTSGVIGNLNWLEFVSGAAATALPGTIQAEEFDAGGEAVGYHDLTPTNLGGAYRPSEAVDIEATTDTGGGYNVGWFTAGEWLAYSASIQAGTYTITARVASAGAGGTFHVEVGGVDRTGPITIPDTGGWQAWQTVTRTGVMLPSGAQTVKVVADTDGPANGAMGNVNSLQFTLESSQTELLADTFDSASLDMNKWSIAVLSGFQDTSVPVGQSNGHLNIGPLLEDTGGSHYNGILSDLSYDLTGASVRVQVVAAANSATAGTTSFTLPSDSLNHYRMFAEAGQLWFEKKIANAKTNFSMAFDPVQHAFWRIRHDPAADEMVFETAPAVSGAPGFWSERRRMARELPITAMRIELKAGTWKLEESAPGTVVFDNLLAVRP